MATPRTLQQNVPLAALTTLKIGGPARFFVRAETENDIAEAFDFGRDNGIPVTILGGGSNVLIADEGIDGLVIQVALTGVVMSEGDGDVVTVTAAAGEDWDGLVRNCVEQDLAGLECMSGIPGLVGGTPVQNVGAYGQEVSETIVTVRSYDRANASTVTLTNSECGFEYRKSIFNTSMRDRYVVLQVTYSLRRGGSPTVSYSDLKEHFAGTGPSLSEVREAVLSIRRSKSMVIDAADPNSRSAGSFFKNPIVSQEHFDELQSQVDHAIPSYRADGGTVKIPAAWLIEHAGFRKGFHLGNAGISTNHTLALINRGGCTAAEIITLKDAIQSAVRSQFGIELVPEPVFLGFSPQKL